MKKGDLAFFTTRTVAVKAGRRVSAAVKREAYQDPTSKDDWSVVELEPLKALARPVTLEEARGIKALANMVLVRKSRLSVPAGDERRGLTRCSPPGRRSTWRQGASSLLLLVVPAGPSGSPTTTWARLVRDHAAPSPWAAIATAAIRGPRRPSPHGHAAVVSSSRAASRTLLLSRVHVDRPRRSSRRAPPRWRPRARRRREGRLRGYDGFADRWIRSVTDCSPDAVAAASAVLVAMAMGSAGLAEGLRRVREEDRDRARRIRPTRIGYKIVQPERRPRRPDDRIAGCLSRRSSRRRDACPIS